MFIKRNKTRYGDKEYTSILLVQGKRVPAARGPGRPPKDAQRATVVVHETLANLTKCPPGLIAVIESWCRSERGEEPPPSSEIAVGPCYGPLAVLRALAEQTGVAAALGTSVEAQRALFLVLARVAAQGSRLSAFRWAKTQAVEEALGFTIGSEDVLYSALDWLEKNQDRIERALTPTLPPGAVFLYDVTSSYFEGQKNELAAPGYNRDGKRRKKQVVLGLLTDRTGRPISVQVYMGNQDDPGTVKDQIAKITARYGKETPVIFVGDRGMIRVHQKEALSEEGFYYVTALSRPEIQTTLERKTVQLGMFDETVFEVVEPDRRLLGRLNPAMRRRAHQRRDDQIAAVQRRIDKREAYVASHPRAKLSTSLTQAESALRTYKLQSFVSAVEENGRVVLRVDEAARAELEALDGCYVVTSNAPADAATAQELWDRYGDLQKVERCFRTMKTAHLELRPIFLRHAGRTRGHAVVAMLALILERAFAAAIAPLGLSVPEALKHLDAVRLVSLAAPELGLWRLPSHLPDTTRDVLGRLPPLKAPLLSPHPP